MRKICGFFDKTRKAVAIGVMLAMTRQLNASSIQQVTLDQGLGFVGYFVIGMIMLTSLILIGVGGYQLSQDSGKGKMTIAAGVLIPVFLAVVYWIFKNILKIDLDFSPTL